MAHKDWFEGRDAHTYTKYNKEKKCYDWEEESKDGYSGFLTGNTDLAQGADSLKTGLSLASNISRVMGFDKKPNIALDDKDSYTDGKTVVCATECFNDPNLSAHGQVDVFLGEYIHESCHVKYTDFRVAQFEFSKMEEAAKKADPADKAQKMAEFKVIKTIENVIDDERIEMALGEELPGYTRFIEIIKSYYFDTKYVEEKEKMTRLKGSLAPEIAEKISVEPKNVGEKLLDTLFKIIRYPKYLDDDTLEKLDGPIKEIKEELTPYPTNTYAVIQSAKVIHQILKRWAEHEDLKEEYGEGMPGDDEKDGEGGSGGETFEEMAGRIADKISSMTAMGEDKLKDISEVKVMVPGDKDGEEKGSSSSGKSRTVGKSERTSMLAEHYYDPEVVDWEPGLDKNVHFIKAKPDKANYQSLARELRNHKIIRTILSREHRDVRLVLKSQKSGVLDVSKLAEAMQGVESVYETYGDVRTSKLCVCLLIDESGSMSGPKIRQAAQTGIMFNEALKGVPDVALFIYGFSGDQRHSGSDEIYVYKEPGYTKPFTLGSCAARCQNRDGRVIYEVGMRVRKFTDKPCIYFVISDGAPCANGYGGNPAIKDTHDKVLMVEKKGFQVIQIAIEEGVPSDRMFKHFVKFTDIKTLPKDLSSLMKKLVKKHIKQIVTY